MESKFQFFMPCLIKDKTGRSPFWYCAYTAPDGRRLKKSTKQEDKKKAWEVCLTFVNAETDIATKSPTEKQLRKGINDALIRLGQHRLTDPSIKKQLNTCVQNKLRSVGEATLV